MELQPNQSLICGEIVIDIPIIINDQYIVENIDIVKKCPHCHTGIGTNFFRGTDETSGITEIGLSCGSCSKKWQVRFKNPFLFIKI